MAETNESPDDELASLLEAVLNRDITPPEQERLAERLSADPQARTEFIRLTAFDAMLTHEFPAADYRVASSALEIADSKPIARTWISRRFTWLSMAAALMLLLGWIAVQKDPWKQVTPANVVAKFSNLNNIRWMDPTTRGLSSNGIRIGQRIELSSGSAEVLFNTGATLKIVGPTIVEARTKNSVFLTMGDVHLVAKTPQSKGFTVVTPTSKFVDISTSFSASVSPDGLSRLTVTEGAVDVVLEGTERSPRLTAGDSLYVEPGERQVMTRIEEGDGTADFKFPTIQPPSREDLADQSRGNVEIRVTRGNLKFKTGKGTSGPISLLTNGTGQSHQDAPNESAFFEDHSSGNFLIDLGQNTAIYKINTYSWHQHETNERHRHRARQRFTLYGYSDEQLPDLTQMPTESGWTRIARVNSDHFFEVATPLDRPAQQASSVTAARGEIGNFRYLLWEANGNTFFGELDVFGAPHHETQN